jgi:hypothetical protein
MHFLSIRRVSHTTYRPPTPICRLEVTRYGQSIVSGFSLRSLEAFLAYGSVIATIGLVLTETLIALPMLVNLDPGSFPVIGTGGHWLAVWFAIGALGMRTLEEGLQPKRELERYQRYSSSIEDIRDRFETDSRQVKFELMIEMERLAFEEMRDFLRSAHESRFIM